jgi:hypothetical protein
LGVRSRAWFSLSQLALHSRNTNFSVLTLDVKVRACPFSPFLTLYWCRIDPTFQFFGKCILQNSPCSLHHSNATPPRPQAQDRAVGGGFFQVHATQAHQRHAYLAERALYNPFFPVHKLPTTPNWVVRNAVCTDVETTLPLP